MLISGNVVPYQHQLYFQMSAVLLYVLVSVLGKGMQQQNAASVVILG